MFKKKKILEARQCQRLGAIYNQLRHQENLYLGLTRTQWKTQLWQKN